MLREEWFSFVQRHVTDEKFVYYMETIDEALEGTFCYRKFMRYLAVNICLCSKKTKKQLTSLSIMK
jgi:hypothetical protein